MGQDKYHRARPPVLVGGSGACKVTMHAKYIHSPVQYNQAKEKKAKDRRSEEKKLPSGARQDGYAEGKS